MTNAMRIPLTAPIDEYAIALADRFETELQLHDPQVGEDIHRVMAAAFRRELVRLPPDGREEFLSAVALELLQWLQGQSSKRNEFVDNRPIILQAIIRRIADTVRHRISRAIHRRKTSTLDDRFVTSNPDELNAATLTSEFKNLDPRETEILALLTAGKSIDEIANATGVGSRTIYRALHSIHHSVVKAMDRPASDDGAK